MTFTIEDLKELSVIKDMEQLAKLHYDELKPYDDIQLKPAWGRLVTLQNLGCLKVYGVRKSKKLIGYALFFMNYAIEYSDSMQASMSNIFIHPDYRGEGVDFISWCDEQLKKEDVQVVYHHVKVKKDYGKMLEHLGYEKMNIQYAKRLDK